MYFPRSLSTILTRCRNIKSILNVVLLGFNIIAFLQSSDRRICQILTPSTTASDSISGSCSVFMHPGVHLKTNTSVVRKTTLFDCCTSGLDPGASIPRKWWSKFPLHAFPSLLLPFFFLSFSLSFPTLTPSPSSLLSLLLSDPLSSLAPPVVRAEPGSKRQSTMKMAKCVHRTKIVTSSSQQHRTSYWITLVPGTQ